VPPNDAGSQHDLVDAWILARGQHDRGHVLLRTSRWRSRRKGCARPRVTSAHCSTPPPNSRTTPRFAGSRRGCRSAPPTSPPGSPRPLRADGCEGLGRARERRWRAHRLPDPSTVAPRVRGRPGAESPPEVEARARATPEVAATTPRQLTFGDHRGDTVG